MRPPTCPDHGRLVLDLAQGRLNDRDAEQAETIRSSCPVCSSWWQAEFEGELAASLDGVVEQAFAQFQPGRRRLPAWMPAAAAAAVAVGVGVLWYGPANVPVDETAHKTLTQESFDGDLNGDGSVDATDLGFAVHGNDGGGAIFTGSLDTGDLSDWDSET